MAKIGDIKVPLRVDIQFGPRDCLRRLIYKLSSQKVVSFVYASAAIFVICWFAVHGKVFTADLAATAIKSIRDVALALLVMRGGQSILTTIFGAKNGQAVGGGAAPDPKGEANVSKI